MVTSRVADVTIGRRSFYSELPALLDDAELVLGLWRHLSAYQVSAPRAALGNLERCGKVYEMAWRLHGSGVSSPERVRAIGIDAKLAPMELARVVMRRLKRSAG